MTLLSGITITGADDEVDPASLVELSRQFPFVEWGILFSPKRQGIWRYPSMKWVGSLLGARLMSSVPVHLSAHFCGACTRETLAGDDRWLILPFVDAFGRVQLNGFEWPADAFVPLAQRMTSKEFILQVRDEATLSNAVQAAAAIRSGEPTARVSALYDPSGGRGVESLGWPTAPPGLRLGYAGGIRAENVEIVLASRMPSGAPDAWIDLESGARDNYDTFDIDRVQEILKKVRPFVNAQALR